MTQSLPSLPRPRYLDAAAPGRPLSPFNHDWTMDAPPDPQPNRPFHVLIVEKDPAMRAMLVGMLAGPYDVEAVGDNLEAGQAVECRLPDLVIVDLYQREPDGLIFVRALQSNPVTAGLPVILLAASTDPTSRFDDRSPNTERTLFKPFGMKELLEVVSSALAPATPVRNARP